MAFAAANPISQPTPVASQWISANAGSGKTTVLTRQVVKLLLLGVPPERICCITYTKAAAGEMRARILKSLRELMLVPDDRAVALITDPDTYGLPCNPDILKRARLLFGTVLDSPAGGIQLTTIHGFCQQVLRAFPLEAGVAPHFVVADDMQTSQLHQQVKLRLLSKEQFEPELAEAITVLAERSGEHRFDALVKALLALDLPAGDLKAQLYERLGIEEGMSEERLIQSALDCLNDAQKSLLRAELPRLQADKAAYKRDLATGLEPWLRGDAMPVDAWLNIFLTQKMTPRTHLQKSEFAPGTPLGDCIAHCIATAERFVAQRAGLALAEETSAALTLAKRLQQLYAEVKAERGILDYDDLITKTRELLTLRDMVGWVMSKLDHRIDHLLIDEAQDTSAEQWRIAYALVDELKDNELHSANVPRTTFVVGDEKQSIFSFQGAAPKLYASMHGQFSELLQHSATPLTERALIPSYRSAPAILRAVDEVARIDAVARALSSSGVPQPHSAKREKAVGQVVLHPPIPAPEKVEQESFVMPKEYVITRSTAQLLAEHVAEKVAAWIVAGEWRAGDILILTRNRKPIVQPLLRALQRRNVPVAGIDRLVLSAHLAVKDLLALARWAASTHDDLALAQVLRSPLMGWSDEQLREAAVNRGALSLYARVEPTADAATLQRWRSAARGNAYDFLTAVLEVDGARKRFVGRFGEEVHEILDELKEQSMHMPAGLAPSVANFVAWMEGSDRQIKRELEAGSHDHVRVMTVHGAKGLEAPCVLMVDTVSMPTLNKEMVSETEQGLPLLALSDAARLAPLWQQSRDRQKDDALAEHYRLLYVAMTRASDALHVFAAEPSRGALPEQCWYSLIAQAFTQLPNVVEHEGCKIFADAGTRAARPAHAVSARASLPGWAQSLPAATKQRAVVTPSGLGRQELAPFKRTRGDAARERGVRLHRVLQFLSASTTRDQLDALVAHLAPDWPAGEQQRAANEVWKLYEAERWLWQHEAQAEVNISGTIAVNGVRYPVFGQIDRLVITPAEVVVLDYKTGREVPPSPVEVGEGYLLQLKLYKALLETLYPGKPVRPAIVWTANAQLMWLDEAVSSIGWDRAQLP